ncbi:MAG: F0F1 ATP synthase subunit epsilon [Candidatus Omnitrophica bacterium]|nr:F0F1 ATP synthase subunit epsilon [Candidatus Omnitrophota bacterium]
MLHVTLCRAHEPLFDGRAGCVVLPSEEGDVSVFEFHAPMLCALGRGELLIDAARFPVQGGIARVARNRVTILVT